MPKARAAALRAIELDDSSAEAHTSLAVIAQNYDWDWSTAEREYRRAIQLNPNYATAHHWFGEFLGLEGRFDESFREFERARQLDPLSLIIAADHGAVLYYARQYDGAIAQFRAVLEMEPNFPRAYNVLGPYAEKGMYAEAAAQMDQWGKSPGDKSWLLAWRAYFYGRSGDQGRARDALEQLKQLNQRQILDPTPFVLANIGLGDKKQALLWLEKASADRSTALTGIKVNPVFDPLRSEPRFQELLRRVGLAN
jgi:serine/threonine-protein kinase